MFITSRNLTKRIELIASEVHTASGGRVAFEEYIALPHNGQLILRFDLLGERFTLNELDEYEELIRRYAGEDFLIDFMGSVYERAGIPLKTLFSAFERCFEAYKYEIVSPSPLAERIESDAQTLIEQLGLPKSTPVWEIQIGEELELLIFDDGESERERYEAAGLVINLVRLDEAERMGCEGLMRAAVYAKRTGISLASAVIGASDAL